MRIIIVSNRAPITLRTSATGYEFVPSAGGLATGLRAFVERQRLSDPTTEMLWVGWPGTAVEPEHQAEVEQQLMEGHGVKSVFLSADVMDRFYQGFCNTTIWPLFHYFPSYSTFDEAQWKEYAAVNEKFADAVASIAQPGDVIWVHDYHLMLLPEMLRARLPKSSIGFFLHIPFPSYEIFRLLPSDCRSSLLRGVFGADLIGFHTYDYCSYFLRSAFRILGLGDRVGEVLHNNRLVKVRNFPMGIDYDLFHDSPTTPEVQQERKSLRESLGSRRVILSVDRQDYTKGILKRLDGFSHFLEAYPQWHQKVVLIIVVIPSRDGVDDYQTVKSRIDEAVGMINGTHGSLDWAPIIYQYRSLTFAELSAVYSESDIALVTPLRDGMNLIAKEYVASCVDGRGVLILSEMAGAVDELDASIVINPNSREEIARAIDEGLRMPPDEQITRTRLMQRRIERSNVVVWAKDFLESLQAIKQEQRRLAAKSLDSTARARVLERFSTASSRLLFLDYDGTLTPIVSHPSKAAPSDELLEILKRLSCVKHTRIVILSGRDRRTLEEWFGGLDVELAAEHGLIIKRRHGEWIPTQRKRNLLRSRMRAILRLPVSIGSTRDREDLPPARHEDWRSIRPIRDDWKDNLRPILHHYTDRLPGSFVEEKEFSLVFHYRTASKQLAQSRVNELVHHLTYLTSQLDLQLLQGKKVLEIRHAGVDKGVAATTWLSELKGENHFILSAGDDTTDEDLFKVMPENAFSIKVGPEASNALFNLEGPEAVLDLLRELIAVAER